MEFNFAIEESDFKYVIDWVIHTADNAKDHDFTDGVITNGDEFVKLMVALTGDKRFASAYNEITENKGKEEIRMCELINKLEARGEKNGIEKSQYTAAVRMFRKGYDEETVKDILPDISTEQLNEARKEAQKRIS